MMKMLSNISGRTDNQTIKFGQLIEYITRNTLLQKPCRETEQG